MLARALSRAAARTAAGTSLTASATANIPTTKIATTITATTNPMVQMQQHTAWRRRGLASAATVAGAAAAPASARSKGGSGDGGGGSKSNSKSKIKSKSNKKTKASKGSSTVSQSSSCLDFSVRDLIDARVHLGHKAGAWCPQMAPYIHGTRAGMHIIDLDQTSVLLKRALEVTRSVAEQNGVILFVGTRPGSEKQIRRAAIEAGEYYVTRKWVGGTLTNCTHTLGAMRHPDLVILFSLPVNDTALAETEACNIPTIGIVDTDSDPACVTYPVPGNDDTPSAIQIYLDLFCAAIAEGKNKSASN